MAVQHPASRLIHLGAQAQRLLFVGAPQIQVAVLEANIFGNLAGAFGMIGDLEGQGFGGAEDLNVRGLHFDLPGSQGRIRIALRPFAHNPGHLNAKFVTQLVRNFFADGHLCDTRSIAQINKGDTPVVTAAIHPPGQRHSAVNITCSQRACITST